MTPEDAPAPRPRLPVAVLPMGTGGLLLEVADLAAVLTLDAALRPLVASGAGPWAAVSDVVPAARTVLLVVRDGTDLAAVRAEVEALAATSALTAGGGARHADPEPSDAVVVPVVYDGPDLEEVARLTGLSPDEVVRAHTSTPWRVAFGGFAPGFAYLVGGDPRLAVPRRASPRASVPAGAVGLAGEFSGVYPRASPGGWQLLGTTDLTLWDERRDPPALLAPGRAVRFVDVEGPA